MRFFFLTILVFTFFVPKKIHGQTLDSLIVLFEGAEKDSLKFAYALEIGTNFLETDLSASILYLEKAKLIWQNQSHLSGKNPTYLAESKLQLNLSTAKALAYQGFLEESSDLLFESLEMINQYRIPGYKSTIYSNLGNHMLTQGLDNLAIPYYRKALHCALEDQEPQKIGLAYGNIGSFLMGKNIDSSLYYFQTSIPYLKSADNSRSKKGALAWVYENLGRIFIEKDKLDSASFYFERSLLMREEIDHKLGMSNILNTIANLKIKTHQFDEAIHYVNRGIDVAEKAGLSKYIYNSYFIRSFIRESKGDYRGALLDFKTGSLKKDSMLNQENQSYLLRKELEYEHREEKFRDSLKNVNAMKLKNLKIAEQNNKIRADRNLRYGLIMIACLLLIIFLVTLSAFYTKKDRNRIIQSQKKELEDKNEKILSSIAYAKRIQKTTLPPLNCMANSFEDSFIYYLPKDIVAGDFYWYKEHGEQIMWAVADCTGHGVPGAILSMMCYQALDRCVREYGLSWPDSILNKARSIIIEELGNESQAEIMDGMDIALCIVKDMTLYYSGAYHPLWLFRNGELIIINGDKNPVGNYPKIAPFTSHEMNLREGDTIYIFSDGFADQFGGKKGKKFKPQKFKELLGNIQEKDMNQQREIIHATFVNWKGEFEQVDDICIVGVKI